MSARRSLLERLPLTTSLPLTVSAAVIAVSLLVSAASVALLQDFINETLHEKASVFMDSFAGHIADTASRDVTRTRQDLKNALEFQTQLGEAGAAIARLSGPIPFTVAYPEEFDGPAVQKALAEALAAGQGADSFEVVGDGRARLTKTYDADNELFALSVLFDARDVKRANNITLFSAVAINALLAIVVIVTAFLASRKLAFSIKSVTTKLAPTSQYNGAGSRNELQNLEQALVAREEDDVLRAEAIRELAERERDALLGRVAAQLAHEVRNPLAGIMAGLSTIRRYGDDASTRNETVGILESGVKALERLADVTLATYRRRSGPQEISVAEVKDLEFIVSPEADKRQVSLRWLGADSGVIFLDADALRQVLVNILLNALRASPPGAEVLIDISLSESALRVTVSDEGPGLPEDVILYLRREAFMRSAPLTRELGIGIVMALVDDMNGRIEVETQAGKGTSLTLVAPQLKKAGLH